MSQKRVEFTPHDLVFERKFDVALRASHAEQAIIGLRNNLGKTLDNKILLKASEKWWKNTQLELETLQLNQHILPTVFTSIFDMHINASDDKTLNQAYSIMKTTLNIQTSWLEESCFDPKRNDLVDFSEGIYSQLYRNQAIRKLHKILRKFDQLVMTIPKADRRKNYTETEDQYIQSIASQAHYEIKELGFKTFWSRNSCVIQATEGDPWVLLPRSYLLMIHNKIADVLSVLVLASSYPTGTYGNTEVPEMTMKFIKECVRLAKKYKDKYFRIAKVLEALVIAETLVESEGASNKTFLKTIASDLEDDTGYDYIGSILQDILLEATPAFRHELGCLAKIMGHPFCDVKAGAETLYDKTNSEKNINIACVAESVRYAKESFVRSYLLRHRKWPLVELSPHAPMRLTMACLTNSDPKHGPSTLRHGVVQLADYDLVELLPVKDFDYLENMIPYIKDRTISLMRNKVFGKYINEPRTHNASDWKDTRLLLFYLFSNMYNLDHIWYIKEFAERGAEDLLNYLVIRAVPKEKELKPKPRCFGCKTYEDRARTLVQEFNSAAFLDLYSDEHAMTLDEISLLKKLHAFMNMTKAYPGYRCIMLNVDASSWNNAFRHEAVAPVMSQTLDRIYNIKLFSRTHEAYENSFVYVPDVGQTYYWNGQKGGIEGLNQDTWVLVYIHQIKVCLADFPYPYHILCKGDDLRVAVLIPPQVLETTTIEQLKIEILTSMSNLGTQFGHTIKVEDSYASETYFAFSKTAFLNHAELPQSFRKIQKCYGANNAFLNTTDDYIASSFSNAHSACKTSPNPISCYNVALFWSTYYILESPQYHQLTRNQIIALLHIPNMLSGFPIIYLHNFLTRAQSDLLVPFIDVLKFCREAFPDIAIYMEKALNQPTSPGNEALSALMSDPYALPIRKPFAASVILRTEVSRLIGKRTKNEQLKELFELKSEGFHETFLKCIKSANVYNAKIISSLYGCTPDGVISTLIRKFESGRSVMDVILLHSSRKSSYRVLRKAAWQDKKIRNYRLQLLKGEIPDSKSLIRSEWMTLCSTEISQNMRDTLWGKPVESVTQPNPHHMITLAHSGQTHMPLRATYNHFKLDVSLPQPTKSGILFTKGQYDPFLGATTGSGLGQPDKRFVSHNFITQAVHTLLDLMRWCVATTVTGHVRVVSNIQDLVVQLLEGYTRQPIAVLAPYMGERVESRTTQHHVRAPNYRQSIVPNTLQNIYTFCQGNSRSHLHVESTGLHYRLNYLELYCFMVSLYARPFWTGSYPRLEGTYWGITVDCPFCMTELRETPMRLIHTRLPSFKLLTMSDVGKKSLKQILTEMDDYEPPTYYTGDREYELSYNNAVRALVQSYVFATFSSRTAIQTYYTGHHMTAASHSVLKNWSGRVSGPGFDATDLETAEPEIILQESTQAIYSNILKILNDPEPNTILTQLRNIPSEEMPWYQLLQDLAVTGKLYELQEYLKERFPDLHVATFDHTRAYAPVFGACCYLAARANFTQTDVILLTTLDNPDILTELEDRLDNHVWTFIRYYLIHPYFQAKSAGPDAKSIELFYRALICAACLSVGWVQRVEENPLIFSKDDLMAGRVLELRPVDFSLDSLELSALIYLDPQDITRKFPFIDLLKASYPGFKIDTYLHEYTTGAVAIINPDDVSDDSDIPPDPTPFDNLEPIVAQKLEHCQIRIWKTTKVECINRIRMTPVQKNMPFQGRLTGAAANFPELRVTGRNNYRQQIRSSTSHKALMRPEEIIEPFQEAHNHKPFNNRWLTRPFGTGNISMSKATVLLHECSLAELPNEGLYLALGDGFGGTASVLAASTTHSTIVFNSLPSMARGIEQKIIPMVASQISNERLNTLDCSSLMTDHYDLALPSTLEWFTQHFTDINLMFCDAEIKKEDLDEPIRKNICHTIIELFLARSANKGVMILKMYYQEYHNICHVIGRIAPFCRHVWLKRTIASSLDGELYVVAQLDNITPPDQHTFPAFRPVHGAVTNIRRFLDRMRVEALDDEEDVDSLSLVQIPTALYRPKARWLPGLGWAKMQEVLGFTVDEGLKKHTTYLHDVWKQKVRKALHPQYKKLLDEYHSLTTATPRTAGKINTQTHKIKIMLPRVVLALGFLHVFEPNYDRLSEHEEHENLHKFIRQHCPDSISSQYEDGNLEKEIRAHGFTFNLSTIYWQGLRWGVYAIAYSHLFRN